MARREPRAREDRLTPASAAAALCTACGLCCDGTLFADVELGGTREVARLEVLGVEVEEPDGDHRGLLIQPCRALAGTRCAIYALRPACCRTFECALLQRLERGAIGLGSARALVADTRARIARIERLAAGLAPVRERLPLRERCAAALAATRDRVTARSLERALAALERRLASAFLGARGRRPLDRARTNH